MTNGQYSLPIIVLLLVGGLGYCQAYLRPDGPALVGELRISPKEINSAETKWLAEHSVYYPTEYPSDYLIVFIPGSFASPNKKTKNKRHLASLYYPVICLSYPSDRPTRLLCNHLPQPPDCHARVRYEILFGENTSELVNVPSESSLVRRLYNLIHFLADHHDSSIDWSDYLNGDSVNWSKLILIGFSQGAGHSAFLARSFEVAGIAMYHGPADYSNPSQNVAQWINSPSATPTEKYYGASHLHDSIIKAAQVKQNWKALADSGRGPVAVTHSTLSSFKLESAESHFYIFSDYLRESKPYLRHNCLVTDGYSGTLDDIKLKKLWTFLALHALSQE